MEAYGIGVCAAVLLANWNLGCACVCVSQPLHWRDWYNILAIPPVGNLILSCVLHLSVLGSQSQFFVSPVHPLHFLLTLPCTLSLFALLLYPSFFLTLLAQLVQKQPLFLLCAPSFEGEKRKRRRDGGVHKAKTKLENWNHGSGGQMNKKSMSQVKRAPTA